VCRSGLSLVKNPLTDCGTISAEGWAASGAAILRPTPLANFFRGWAGTRALGPMLRESFFDFVRVTCAMLLNTSFAVLVAALSRGVFLLRLI